MSDYAFVNSENEVVSILHFEELQSVDLLNHITTVDGHKDTNYVLVDSNCAVGWIYEGDKFKPKKPGIDYVWDETYEQWRLPRVSPVYTKPITNPFTFFHIPKTSGKFFDANVPSVIEDAFLYNGIQYGEFLKSGQHRSFKPVDTQDVYGLTFLREPVVRTVSHWCHIYGRRNTGNIDYDKSMFFSFLESMPESGIINYQTKFITYNGNEEAVNTDESGLVKYVNSSDLEFAKTRLSKVSLVLDSKFQSFELCQKVIDNICNHFGVPTITVGTVENIPNESSYVLYNALTKSEISKIEQIMSIDMDLYNSTTFTIL